MVRMYGTQVCQQMEKGKTEEVDHRMSIMKPITANWMIDLHAHFSSHPSIIINGFRHACIKGCVEQLK